MRVVGLKCLFLSSCHDFRLFILLHSYTHGVSVTEPAAGSFDYVPWMAGGKSLREQGLSCVPFTLRTTPSFPCIMGLHECMEGRHSSVVRVYGCRGALVGIGASKVKKKELRLDR